MSKNDGTSEVQGERKAELDRALLSRSLHSPLQLVCDGKGKHKKEVYETTSYTSVGFSVGSVGFSAGITLYAPPQRHFYTLPSVAARAA